MSFYSRCPVPCLICDALSQKCRQCGIYLQTPSNELCSLCTGEEKVCGSCYGAFRHELRTPCPIYEYLGDLTKLNIMPPLNIASGIRATLWKCEKCRKTCGEFGSKPATYSSLYCDECALSRVSLPPLTEGAIDWRYCTGCGDFGVDPVTSPSMRCGKCVALANTESNESEVVVHKSGCECGAASLGYNTHSAWCPRHE